MVQYFAKFQSFGGNSLQSEYCKELYKSNAKTVYAVLNSTTF